MTELDWFIAEATTQIVVPRRRIHKWRGRFVPTDDFDDVEIVTPADDFRIATDEEPSDYSLAAEGEKDPAKGLVWRLDFEGFQILVLSMEISMNTWVADPGGGGVFVRDHYRSAGADEIVDEALRSLPELDWEHELDWEVKDAPLRLLDAGEPGFAPEEWPYDFLEIDLQPGTYRVETADYLPDDAVHLTLHRLVKS